MDTLTAFILYGVPAGYILILTMARVFMGLFFVLSGYHKLSDPRRHKSMLATMKADGIPFPHFSAWFVSGVEFFAGSALVLGLATPIAILGLLSICLVACGTDGLKRIPAMQPIDRADWLDDLMYLPETIYIVLLAVLLFFGAGPWSLDAMILGAL